MESLSTDLGEQEQRKGMKKGLDLCPMSFYTDVKWEERKWVQLQQCKQKTQPTTALTQQSRHLTSKSDLHHWELETPESYSENLHPGLQRKERKKTQNYWGPFATPWLLLEWVFHNPAFPRIS